MKAFFKKHGTLLSLYLIILISLAPFYFSGGFIGDAGDPVGQNIPNKLLLINFIKSGTLPLWNPYSFLGMPFLADPQVGAFYLPDIIFFLIFSPFHAHNASVLFHLLFAATGTYFLAKKLSNSELIGITLSATLALTGSFISKLVFLNFLETIAFLPWLFLISTQQKKLIPKFAILSALMIFAGHPVAVFYNLISLIIFNLIYHFRSKKLFTQLKNTVLGLGLGALLASIQLLPTIELILHSVRKSLTFEQFIEGHLVIKDLKNLLLPTSDFLSGNPVDFYIHFGSIAFFAFLISFFSIKKYPKKDLPIYLTGITLSLLGLILSLGNAIPLSSKILFHTPILNTFRVPARYAIIFHIGTIITLSIFLKYLLQKYKKIGKIITISILINSILIPGIFLTRHEISELEKQYSPEIAQKFQSPTPEYFLSSSYFLFPNRHIPGKLFNITGYNPLILQNFYDKFPVSPVGTFENPDYFNEYYDQLTEIGLTYYIFPSEEFLTQNNLAAKISTINFLKAKNWKPIEQNETYTIWKNPSPTPFAYFKNPENKVTKIDFSPNKIVLHLEMQTPDNPNAKPPKNLLSQLIVNQSLYPGWEAASEKYPGHVTKTYKNLTHSYDLLPDITRLTLTYKPKSLQYGALISFIAFITLIFTFKKKKT